MCPNRTETEVDPSSPNTQNSQDTQSHRGKQLRYAPNQLHDLADLVEAETFESDGSSDEELLERVMNALNRRNDIDVSSLQVQIESGRALITGKIASELDRLKIVEVVGGVLGVTGVEARLSTDLEKHS